MRSTLLLDDISKLIISRDTHVDNIRTLSDKINTITEKILENKDGFNNIIEKLERFDINLKTELLADIVNHVAHITRDDDDDMVNMIAKKSLCSLYEVMENILKILEKILDKIEVHRNKWFHYWRALYCDKNLDQLDKYITILDGRLDMAFKLIRI
jgi:hypothetical protein